MLNHSVLAVALAALAGCVHNPATTPVACTVGSSCSIEGRLTLHPGEPASAAIVESGNTCFKVALPEDFYVGSKDWNGNNIKVTGRSFQQRTFNDDEAVLWYSEQDRKLAMGMYGQGLDIYADSMQTASGKSWDGATAP